MKLIGLPDFFILINFWSSFMIFWIMTTSIRLTLLSSDNDHIPFKLGKSRKHGKNQATNRRIVNRAHIQNVNLHLIFKQLLNHLQIFTCITRKSIQLSDDNHIVWLNDCQQASKFWSFGSRSRIFFLKYFVSPSLLQQLQLCR